MANFSTAFQLTMGNEGGYANNPADRGGETYKGIARNFWPSWKGWPIVDQVKNAKPASLDKALASRTDLQNLVQDFYKVHFWDINKLDSISEQDIANELFDTGVNMGTSVAAKFLQEALNYSNKNQTSYPDLIVDGDIGPKTLATYQKQPNKKQLLKLLNILQGERYLNIIRNSPSQEVFLSSWFSRVAI
ncbi:hypothetical protein FW774_05835 [Pedobacter sp. BS3]|uniref:glycoside hydrolase family 108 protein n=1 Tax=Pedobacter sp. BS3 TaxID=2567937 RepID=UPI0011EF9401|nr:glycosyl hydrolase 108 family protein [Pedobacter sp. BS3]TZF84507.1 hypothetical protein FW774_05835 [Pedobacter sp. BS3]